MNPFLFVAAAFLMAVHLTLCLEIWRVLSGRAKPRPLKDRVGIAGVFGLVGWQALMWLRADHALASQVRTIGVWVELFATFGIAAAMLATEWVPRVRIGKIRN